MHRKATGETNAVTFHVPPGEGNAQNQVLRPASTRARARRDRHSPVRVEGHGRSRQPPLLSPQNAPAPQASMRNEARICVFPEEETAVTFQLSGRRERAGEPWPAGRHAPRRSRRSKAEVRRTHPDQPGIPTVRFDPRREDAVRPEDDGGAGTEETSGSTAARTPARSSSGRTPGKRLSDVLAGKPLCLNSTIEYPDFEDSQAITAPAGPPPTTHTSARISTDPIPALVATHLSRVSPRSSRDMPSAGGRKPGGSSGATPDVPAR